MFTKSRFFILIFLMAGCFTGCVPFLKAPSERHPTGTLEERLALSYLREGWAYENQGDLVEALDAYAIARTIRPSNQEIIDSHDRVERALQTRAEEHYTAGLEFHKDGKYEDARRQFLMALRLRPDYPEAVKILISREHIQIKSYVLHTIQEGDNLSELSMLYYGVYHKFPIIAKYNNIKDVTRIPVGQQIKIPEVEGTPFLKGEGNVRPTQPETIFWGFWDMERPDSELPPDTASETADLREQASQYVAHNHVLFDHDHGIELFLKKKYPEAIQEFQKILDLDPDDGIAKNYCYRSHLEVGMTLLRDKHYLEAKSHFEKALVYNKTCSFCQYYLKQTENLYKEVHYKKGVEYYGKEKLLEAIQEWELVSFLDPKYKKVEELITKAKNILIKLEEIRDNKELNPPMTSNMPPPF